MRHLLACDLDGTLIPTDPGPEGRRAVSAFRAAVESADPPWSLAYVTGRHLELALQGVEETGLPRPDALACDVGTSVWWWRDGSWLPDEAFREEMRRAMGGADADGVREALDGIDGLSLQEPAKQAPFKASYYFPWPDRSRVSEEVGRRLEEAGIRGGRVVSRDALDGRGLLDILPEGGAKDRAVRHLARALDAPPERVAFAGDSGNDTAALLGGWAAVLVGNAPEALKEEVRIRAGREGLAERVHVARARWGEGVLEGLDALGFRRGG